MSTNYTAPAKDEPTVQLPGDGDNAVAASAAGIQQLANLVRYVRTMMALENVLPMVPDGSYVGDFKAIAFAVVSGKPTWVALGTSDEIQTSHDLVTWTERTSANSATQSIAYGSGKFVAVGAGGDIQTSPDGITWTARSAAGAYSDNFTSVIWASALSLFVAVGWAGEIQTSPDGITWTHRSAAGAYSGRFTNVVTNASGFLVAIGYSALQIQTSPDGITWTARTAPSTGQLSALHFGNGLYVAAGTDGTDAVIQTSPDGITWTTRSIDSAGSWGTAGSFRVGIYAFGSHVIFGQSVNGKAQYFQTSPDGITWTNHDVEDMSILRFECCATDGRRLLTGGTGGRLFASLRAA